MPPRAGRVRFARSRARPSSQASSAASGAAPPHLLPSTASSRLSDLDEPATAGGERVASELKEEQDDDDDKGLLLSMYAAHGRIGAAFYDAPQRKLLLLEDAPELGLAPAHVAREHGRDELDGSAGGSTASTADDARAKEVAEMLIEQLKPDCVFVPSKTSAASLDAISAALRDAGGKLEVRPANEFGFLAGKGRIHALHLPASEAQEADVVHGGDTELRDALRVGSLVNLETMKLSTGAANSLLLHLTRASGLGDAALPITSVEMLSLDECVSVDADSRLGLGVFYEEAHATLHSSRGKEGLSIYTLLNQTVTPMGRHMLRRWLLLPSRSLPLLTARLDAVECLSAPINSNTTAALRTCLSGVPIVPKLVLRVRKGDADTGVLKRIVTFCQAARNVRGDVRTLEGGEGVPLLRKIQDSFSARAFVKLSDGVLDVINWEESEEQRRTCVQPGIDSELDDWKRAYAALPTTLSQIASTLTAKLGLEASISIVYFPQLGYLHAVPLVEGEQPELAGERYGWQFQFASEVAGYWRSDESRHLDHHFGDLHSLIAEREIEIVHRLQEEISEYAPFLTQCHTLCTELDCLLSFAATAKQYDYVRPELDLSPHLVIRDGRHPLQEFCVDQFVPNDTLLIAGRGIGSTADPATEGAGASLAIVTGANAGGKSVYLKQVALIVFLAQVGSFVPATSARIGLVDKILTRVQAAESVGRLQSSFTLDMGQVSRALRSATPRSLILLDEMGKGTLASDGAALFAATCLDLLERGDSCPRTLAATHFHDVFHHRFLPASLPYATAHMALIIDDSADGLDQLTYLYKVTPGLALQSHASICARAAGLPAHVVERANYVTELAAKHDLARLALEDAQSSDDDEGASRSARPSRTSSRSVRKAEAIARRFVEWDLETESAGHGGAASREATLAKLRQVLGGSDDDK